MEDLFGFIVLIAAVVSAISKSKKKKQSKSVKPATNTTMQTVMEWIEEISEEEPATAPEQPQKQETANAEAEQAAPALRHGDASVAKPRVKTTVEVKAEPAPVIGSLGEDTHEGLHPCDEHEGSALAGAQARPQYEEGGLKLDWTGENMVKAFIMQEVLTRPSQRRRA